MNINFDKENQLITYLFKGEEKNHYSLNNIDTDNLLIEVGKLLDKNWAVKNGIYELLEIVNLNTEETIDWKKIITLIERKYYFQHLNNNVYEKEEDSLNSFKHTIIELIRQSHENSEDDTNKLIDDLVNKKILELNLI